MCQAIVPFIHPLSVYVCICVYVCACVHMRYQITVLYYLCKNVSKLDTLTHKPYSKTQGTKSLQEFKFLQATKSLGP